MGIRVHPMSRARQAAVVFVTAGTTYLVADALATWLTAATAAVAGVAS